MTSFGRHRIRAASCAAALAGTTAIAIAWAGPQLLPEASDGSGPPGKQPGGASPYANGLPRASQGGTSDRPRAVLAAATSNAGQAPNNRDELFGISEPAADPGPGSNPPRGSSNSRDDLFGTGQSEPAAAKKGAADALPQPHAATPAQADPVSRDELFGTGEPAASPPAAGASGRAQAAPPITWRGFAQFTPAYIYSSPSHWSEAQLLGQVEALGQINSDVKWKVSLRGFVDFVYLNSDFYSEAVKQDQRTQLEFRETYIDWSSGDWDMRFGRQQIVWGEAVGLFVADVVSAVDLRWFLLPEFDIIRTPQWAIRAERFWKDSHLELVWIPYPTYDNIGVPGSDYFLFQPASVPGFATDILPDTRPSTNISNTNYGARFSTLIGGWDWSAFAYRSMSSQPTFYRSVILSPTPTIQYLPQHDPIMQVGGTVTKDFRTFVVRGEAVYTADRPYEVSDPTITNGVVKEPAFEYVLSAEFPFANDVRLNVQAYQRFLYNYNPTTVQPQTESIATILLSGKIGPKVEPQIMYMQALGSDTSSLVRPRVDYLMDSRTRLRFGVDIFSGTPTGIFGRFDNKDRVYAELRYTF